MPTISITQELIIRIAFRWLANSFGLWIAGRLLPDVSHGDEISIIIFAALILSIINAVIKPVVTILSLPAIVLSLGIFTIFVNGLMVYIASSFVGSFEISSFGGAVLAGIIIGLVNYIVTTLLEERIINSRK